MANVRISLSLVLSALTLCSAFNVFVPEDKELVYDYRTLMKAGTQIPTDFLSGTYIRGKLHVQRVGNTINVKFSDLKHNMYNGEGYHNFYMNTKEQPMPDEMADMYKPFQVMYDASGKVDAIGMTTGEKEYVKNIKRSVASIFQIDMHQVSLGKHHSFMTLEPSIYGMHKMAYNVIPQDDNLVIVHKTHEMDSNMDIDHMYPFRFNNVEPEYCEVHYEPPFFHDMERTYHIKNVEGAQMAETIHAYGANLVYAFHGKSDAQYLFTNQSFHLEDVKPIEQKITVESRVVEHDIAYNMYKTDVEYDNLADIFHGRRNVDIKTHISQIYSMLEDVIKYLNKNHIVPEVPDVHHGQMVNRLVRFLMYFKYADFEEVFNTLSQKTSEHDKQVMEIYQELLPLVGTHASITFIKHIIHQKQVKDYVAIEMLSKIPFNVKLPTVKLLEDVKGMVEWDDSISWNVRKAALFSFSSLIHKTFTSTKRLHFHSYSNKMEHHDDKHVEHAHFVEEMDKKFLDENPSFEKFVQMIVSYFQKATDDEHKKVAISAMSNIKFDYILQYLEPIVKGEIQVSPDVRMVAMYSIFPIVVKNPEKVFEFYWPILTDRTLPTDLRVTAYFSIMDSHPSMSTLFNIFSFMESELNHQMYKIHYDYLKAMAQTKDKCHSIVKDRLTAILKFTRPPVFNGFEGFYKLDYIDNKFDFGDDFQLLYTSTKSVHSFFFVHNTQVMGTLLNPYSILVRIHGLDDFDFKKLQLNHESTKELFNFDHVFSLFNSIRSKHEIKIEVSVFEHGNLVHYAIANHNNLKDLSWFVQLWQQPSVLKKFVDINYDYQSMILTPTDMGLPAKLDMFVPSVKYLIFNMTKRNNGITLNNQYKMWRHSWSGLSFYNPFADVWQGISRLHSYDSALPVNVDIDMKSDGIRINMKRFHDEQRDISGFRSHVQSMVYVKDDFHHGSLEKSCEFCKHWVEVSKVAKRNTTIIDYKDKTFGSKVQMLSFDNEYGSPEINDIKKYLYKVENKHFTTLIGYLFLMHYHFHSWFTFHPYPLTQGMVMRAVPLKEFPVSEIEFNFQFRQEVNHEPAMTLPGWKAYLTGSYQAKSEEGTLLKSMVVDTRIDMKPGHKINNYKMLITYQDPDVGNKVFNIDGNRKYLDDRDTGRFTVSVAQDSTKDDVILDVTVEGKKSDDMTTEEYGECISHMITYPKSYFPSYYVDCTSRVDDFTNYIYTVKYQNLPEFFNRTLEKALRSSMSIFKFNSEMREERVDQNTVKVYVNYPVQSEYASGKEEEIHSYPFFDYITDEKQHNTMMFEDKHALVDFPLGMVSYFGLRPSNMRHSRLYEFMYAMGFVQTCLITPQTVTVNDENVIPHQVKQDWSLYGGNSEVDPKCGFYAKQVGNAMALKVVFKDKTVEVYPMGDNNEHFKIVVNGKVIDYNQIHYSEDSFAISVHANFVDILNYEVGVNFIYTENLIHVEIPNHSGHFAGICYSLH